MMLKSEKGIGLVEIIIAILIFGIGITAALRTLPDSNKATTRSRNISIATNLAQEKIEDLVGSPYNSAELSAGTHTDPSNPIDIHYTRLWTITDDVPLVDMKRIDVTVSFVTGSKDSTVTLTTYLTSRR